MTTEEMKALGRRVAQAWNEGKPEILDEVYSPDFINHFTGEKHERLKQAIQGIGLLSPASTLRLMSSSSRATDRSPLDRSEHSYRHLHGNSGHRRAR